jgi:hypothetical protein
MRVFTEMRELVYTHKEILQKLEELERKDIEHEEEILLIFKYLKQFEEDRRHLEEFRERRKLGFRQNED